MKFEVIYADPAWKFRNEKTGGNHKSGAAQKYPVMELADIKRLAVPSISTMNAVLALWCPTALKFSHGYTTALAWDFTHYVTTWYWDKQKLGMGFWGRNVVEELLIFTRTQGCREPFMLQQPNMLHIPEEEGGPDPSMVLHQRAGEHSTKPEDFRKMIESATKIYSSRRNVELFARRVVPGWTGLGHVVTGNDIRNDIKAQAII